MQSSDTARPKTIGYRRATFATQLPVDYLYSPTHAWMARQEGDLWRVGLTKFATRMLGDMVDHGLELEPGSPVEPGQIVGWMEGFKAMSDLYCVARGSFVRVNPLLKEKIGLVNKEPYGGGWIYEILGAPDERCMAVEGYVQVLDKTIDKILEKQKGEEIQ